MAEWFKAADLSSAEGDLSWVRIPLLSSSFFIPLRITILLRFLFFFFVLLLYQPSVTQEKVLRDQNCSFLLFVVPSSTHGT